MARLTYIAGAAIMAANSAAGASINPEAPLEAIAFCLIAIVDGLLNRHPSVLHTLGGHNPHV